MPTDDTIARDRALFEIALSRIAAAGFQVEAALFARALDISFNVERDTARLRIVKLRAVESREEPF